MSQETTNRTFDELASGLASGTLSRGRALKLMGAALVGGALASLGMGEAGADLCKRAGKACKKNTQCCSGICSGGTCAACPSGQVLCNENCVSNSCPTGQTFSSSTCQCECPSGQVLCGGSCVSNTCRDPGQTFNTTTCQCEPTGTTEYGCLCEDGNFFSACRTGDCEQETRNAVCAPLCESHGGIREPGPYCFANEPVCGGTPA